MSNYIVNLAVSQQVAPTPSNLQKTGALVSQGATTLAAGSTSLLTQTSDLTPLLAGSIAISSMSWASSTVTVTLAGPHGIPSGDTVQAVISGVTPTAYNGTVNVTYTGANTFTFPLATNPGSVTVQGTFTLEDVGELVAMVTTFFAQGNSASVYVLELGTGTAAQGVTALNAYIAAPSIPMYAYLLPRPWGGEPTAATMANNATELTAKMYFFATVTAVQYSAWAGYKSAVCMIEATGIPVTEFSLASMFYAVLATSPGIVSQVAPFAFRYSYGTTNAVFTGPQKTTYKAAFVNWIDTGAEGGISNKILRWGTTMDGRDFSYWYACDWVQINSQLMLANAIINGSNNPQNPLYYNQNGINRLQAVAQGVVNSGISYGMVSGSPVVAAIPYSTYVNTNPSDYPAGIYNGLSLTFTPNRGFKSITFNITVSDFAAA